MARVLITTVPFGERDRKPLDLLEQAGIEYVINPYNKKLTAQQLAALIPGFDAVIAGTEEINADVLNQANQLRFISRVGIGLDSVDLLAAREKNIAVSYTPDAPAPAVAELAVGLMLSLLRHTQVSNMQMHQGNWHRFFGRRLAETTVGILGTGRIGSRVLEHLAGFRPARVLVNDLKPSDELQRKYGFEHCSKEEIYTQADVISLHLPLTPGTRNLITKKELEMMKSDAIVVNTARGGIINETDLYNVMNAGHLSGAAIDVFQQEPYNGPLKEIERIILTAHMGSMSVDCRTKMEIEATEEAIRFLTQQSLKNQVPDSEYEILSQAK